MRGLCERVFSTTPAALPVWAEIRPCSTSSLTHALRAPHIPSLPRVSRGRGCPASSCLAHCRGLQELEIRDNVAALPYLLPLRMIELTQGD